jgi:hypothetical protein
MLLLLLLLLLPFDIIEIPSPSHLLLQGCVGQAE